MNDTTSPKTVDKYQDALKQAGDRMDGHPVVIVTDIHTQTDHVHKFALDLAKQKGGVLALEIFTPEMQLLIDAYAEKRISRDDFTSILVDKDGKPEDAGFATTEMYIGKERALKNAASIADAIDSGQKVFAVGSHRGIDQFSSDPKNVERLTEAYILAAKAQVQQIEYMRAHAADIQKNPQKYLDDTIAKADRAIQAISDPDLQKSMHKIFVERVQEINAAREKGTSIDYTARIQSFHAYTLPTYQEWWKKDDDIEADKAKIDQSQSGKFMTRILLERQEADADTAHKIKQIAEQTGKPVIVVYGIGHTLTGEEYGLNSRGGIDTFLRKDGLRPLVFDMVVGDVNCPPKNNFCSKNSTMSNAFLDAARDENDPYRYVINIDPKDMTSPVLSPISGTTWLRNIVEDIRQIGR